jgi:hypothetical protein
MLYYHCFITPKLITQYLVSTIRVTVVTNNCMREAIKLSIVVSTIMLGSIADQIKMKVRQKKPVEAR